MHSLPKPPASGDSTPRTSDRRRVGTPHRGDATLGRYRYLYPVAWMATQPASTASWSGWPDLNRRPLRPELSAQPGKSAGLRHSGTSEAFNRDTMAASDRTCQPVTAPIPLPKSDTATNATRRTDGAMPASRIPR
jgi:hypothetical protein